MTLNKCNVTLFQTCYFLSEGPHHRHACVCDEEEAEKLRRDTKWQSLQVLEDGFLKGVTRDNYSFCIFPDNEKAIYVRHRSCSLTPRCRVCASDNFVRTVKQNLCLNAGIGGKWRKSLLLKVGEADPRPKSPEALAQRKLVGFVTFQFFCFWKKKSENEYISHGL